MCSDDLRDRCDELGETGLITCPKCSCEWNPWTGISRRNGPSAIQLDQLFYLSNYTETDHLPGVDCNNLDVSVNNSSVLQCSMATDFGSGKAGVSAPGNR